MTLLRKTPWDKRNFNIETYELSNSSPEALQETDELEGHFTLKMDPKEKNKDILEHGFYYVDTLLEPVCKEEQLNLFTNERAHLSASYPADEIDEIARSVFDFGRFHRDFNIPDTLADLRYLNWVRDLKEENLLFGLYWDDELAGFYGYKDNQVLLLGIKEAFRGKGLAKLFTSQACDAQFKLGHNRLKTSISASNAPSLNVFYSLGFRLAGAVDVYHKLNGPRPEEG
ncbi:hypothetical protein JNUCC1_00282 [Lentibacillus sp. JNUCC-1]|uniref:GNAT family N-acetyltransferase n=1 Tax=Lentibacillus sp. JNUCC-1 TaxID=2654513 RepID=UPI0012E7AA41|nr:GNAT family N-acetyltransferase [Lentibacillus sp. JNUCC-1]MUV36480.1 hypothetical protein [Lentibacillus sp. JNUCC-1]